MKSLSYLFTGEHPKNWDDCIDYCHCNLDFPAKPEISLSLRLCKRIYNDFILISFYGNYTWIFPDNTRCDFKKVYSNVCEYESPERHELMRLVADRKLENDLEMFKEQGIRVIPAALPQENWFTTAYPGLRCS